MKKFAILICFLVMLLSFVGCSSPQIGDATVDSANNFEVKLISAEFVDKINMDDDSENFLMPIVDDNTKHTLASENGNALFHYTLEYKFVGKEQVADNFRDFAQPILKYDDGYTFKEKYVSIQNIDSKWYYLASDISSDVLSKNFNVDNTYFYIEKTYKPLDDKIYQVRGFIIVPEKVKNDSKSLEFGLRSMGQFYVVK